MIMKKLIALLIAVLAISATTIPAMAATSKLVALFLAILTLTALFIPSAMALSGGYKVSKRSAVTDCVGMMA